MQCAKAGELKGFRKVFCEPGEMKQAVFELNKRSFAYYNTEIADWYAESGTYEILVGASSDDIRLRKAVTVESTITIKKTYDAYVTMGELMEIPAGQQIVNGMMAGYQMPEISPEEKERILNDEDNVEDVAMDYAAMGMDMPLTKVADMSEGAFTEEAVMGIVQMLNQ